MKKLLTLIGLVLLCALASCLEGREITNVKRATFSSNGNEVQMICGNYLYIIEGKGYYDTTWQTAIRIGGFFAKVDSISADTMTIWSKFNGCNLKIEMSEKPDVYYHENKM